MGRNSTFGALLLATITAAFPPAAAHAQNGEAPPLRIERDGADPVTVQVERPRGFSAVRVAALEELGWTVREVDGVVTASVDGRAELVLRPGSPFFRWNEAPLQMVDPAYRDDQDRVWVPLQLLSDFLPARLPDYYTFSREPPTLRAGSPASGHTLAPGEDGPRSDVEPMQQVETELERPTGPSPYDGVRVVWIDAGHGGADPGAIGPGGVREKDIALGIARRLQRLLEDEDRIEVRMTREDDRFVDLWERGLQATEEKGERPGVFLSIHANSLPTGRSTRGFETYFLSEARTDDERRVSAIENAPLSIRGRGVDANRRSDLDFILRELRNFDHQHWSALLAQMVQDEFARFHPGPNRGVKQGPLAVLTNSLMPSVLVEVGFVSNQTESVLLVRDDFQDRAASALATAVRRFLQRYPPGNGLGTGR